jgi:HAD superfamily hydrolase (TIGR01509 family)
LGLINESREVAAVKSIVLDMMGVILEAADDVEELLVPFVAEHGGNTRGGVIQSAYLRASLGELSADAFWQAVGLSAALEDAYLDRHRLRDGACDFLRMANAEGAKVYCLSNDIGRWSLKLRRKFGLDQYLAGAIISGDCGIRKPDEEIYRALLEALGPSRPGVIFVDDRERNVLAARCLGIEAILFDPSMGFDDVAMRALGHAL